MSFVISYSHIALISYMKNRQFKDLYSYKFWYIAILVILTENVSHCRVCDLKNVPSLTLS